MNLPDDLAAEIGREKQYRAAAQVVLMVALHEDEERIGFNRILELTGLTKSSLTVLMAYIKGRGWLESAPLKDDGKRLHYRVRKVRSPNLSTESGDDEKYGERTFESDKSTVAELIANEKSTVSEPLSESKGTVAELFDAADDADTRDAGGDTTSVSESDSRRESSSGGNPESPLPPLPDATEPLVAAVAECCGWPADAVPMRELGKVELAVEFCRKRGIRPPDVTRFRSKWDRPKPPYPGQIETEWYRVMGRDWKPSANGNGSRAKPPPAALPPAMSEEQKREIRNSATSRPPDLGGPKREEKHHDSAR